MQWYRLFRKSDDGTTITVKSPVAYLVWGTSSSATAINTAGDVGMATYFSSSATSGTTYARYNKLTASGAGVEAIAGRDRTVLSAAAANAHGAHDTLEVSSTGYVTGLGTGVRGNIVTDNSVVPAGTYYGVLAEIYPGGNTAALPSASNACLGINAQAGTASDATVNAISFSGTDGSGKMIYTHAPTTLAGSVRVLINGAVKYMPFYTTQ